MASEKSILRALDLLTIASRAEIESLEGGASAHVDNMRGIIDSKNVVALGISEKISKGKTTGKLSLTFYVERKIPLEKLRANIAVPPAVPEAVSGPEAIPTDVVVIGRPRLEVKDLAHPLVTRNPVQPGFSIGHVKVTAGTIGAIVSKDKQFFILSNSHVLANSGKGKKGDQILYPGRADGGTVSKDLVAELFDYVKFQAGGEFVNHVDCAIALPLSGRLNELTSEIKGLFTPRGTIKPKRGMEVTKVGRTTGKSTGRIKDVNFRAIVNYPGIGKVGFIDQVFCSRYTNGGDSGSLVIDRETGKAVGLHFLGYPDENGVMGSFFNPIQDVLTGLGVKLVTKPVKLD